MKTRQLGKDGPFLTVIGLGTWAIGGPWEWGWGPQNDQDSLQAIQRALDLGINWIDTAAVYGLGHAEEILAKALQGKRDKVFLATKCGLVWDDRGRVTNNNRPDSIMREAENSLKRLNTEYIDLYQIHWPDPRTPLEASWEAIDKLRQQGKVKYIGASNFNVRLLETCQQVSHVQSLQPPYSLLDRRVEEDIFPWCRHNQTGVVAYSPLQSGLLTGSFDKSRLAPDDWRHKGAHFKEPALSKHLAFVEQLKPIAEQLGTTVLQLSIAWVLMHPAVTSAIVGARRAEQVDAMVGAMEIKIDSRTAQRIETARQNCLK